jgi:integrase/recombinase XerD
MEYSLHSLLGEYLTEMAVTSCAETTLRVRGIYLGNALKWFRQNQIRTPQAVTAAHLRCYQQHLFRQRKRNGQPLAISSQCSRLSVIKGWFQWMVKRSVIPASPAEPLQLPRLGYKLPIYLNQEEAESVLGQPCLTTPIGIRDRALLEVLYSTGLRRTEILQLHLHDIDKNHCLVIVRGGKGKRDRIVPIEKPGDGRDVSSFSQHSRVTCSSGNDSRRLQLRYCYRTFSVPLLTLRTVDMT